MAETFNRTVNEPTHTPAYAPTVYPRHENARTNIFTINPAFYPAGRILYSLSNLIRPDEQRNLITSWIPSVPARARPSATVRQPHILFYFLPDSVFRTSFAKANVKCSRQ